MPLQQTRHYWNIIRYFSCQIELKNSKQENKIRHFIGRPIAYFTVCILLTPCYQRKAPHQSQEYFHKSRHPPSCGKHTLCTVCSSQRVEVLAAHVPQLSIRPKALRLPRWYPDIWVLKIYQISSKFTVQKRDFPNAPHHNTRNLQH